VTRLPVSQVIANTKLYLQKMTGNASFATPNPTLAAISAQLTKLEASYLLSQSRAKGTVSQMRTDLKTLVILLKALAAYVEGIANADPDNAVTIIQSAGMVVKKTPNRAPKTFTAVVGKSPGSALLNTKAVSRSTYLYEMTTDPTNAASWVQIAANLTVKFIKTGLTSGTRYYFRVAVVTKGIQGAWSHVLNVMIP
jgi:hypothetical protein